MIWVVIVCWLGLPAGWMLLRRIPLCGATNLEPSQPLSVVIPARNEEKNLPRLLRSIPMTNSYRVEIQVVDDSSTDATAAVARRHDATVIASGPLPSGWMGKTWACSQGAAAAKHDLLLFLDADTYFAPGGFERMTGFREVRGAECLAMSVLPYHLMHKPYEQLSLVFNLLMAFGAGGFGAVGRPKLFGQSLLIDRQLYMQSGGHSAVRHSILENLHLSSNIIASGGTCVCMGGRGTLNIRMFPEGFAQLSEGWSKAFADGAAASDLPVLLLTIVWLTALCATFLGLVLAPGLWHGSFGLVYLCFVLQVAWLARQIGNYHWLAAVLYPLPLVFFFGIFAQSLLRRVLKRKARWRGRSV